MLHAIPLFLARPDLLPKLLVFGVFVAIYLAFAVARQGREARREYRARHKR
jgi:hypothetical protein